MITPSMHRWTMHSTLTLSTSHKDRVRGVAVELSVASARALVQTIQAVLSQADAGGYIEETLQETDASAS